jgi:hypothetical protein
MSDKNELSTFEIVFKGYLWVNLPITVIMLAVWYCLSTFASLGTSISIVIATALGWYYWEVSIKKWIKWALDNNVNQERLLKLGQAWLLLWNRSTIDKVLNEKK